MRYCKQPSFIVVAIALIGVLFNRDLTGGEIVRLNCEMLRAAQVHSRPLGLLFSRGLADGEIDNCESLDLKQFLRILPSILHSATIKA